MHKKNDETRFFLMNAYIFLKKLFSEEKNSYIQRFFFPFFFLIYISRLKRKRKKEVKLERRNFFHDFFYLFLKRGR